jgi:hypothetical protein
VLYEQKSSTSCRGTAATAGVADAGKGAKQTCHHRVDDPVRERVPPQRDPSLFSINREKAGVHRPLAIKVFDDKHRFE